MTSSPNSLHHCLHPTRAVNNSSSFISIFAQMMNWKRSVAQGVIQGTKSHLRSSLVDSFKFGNLMPINACIFMNKAVKLFLSIEISLYQVQMQNKSFSDRRFCFERESTELMRLLDHYGAQWVYWVQSSVLGFTSWLESWESFWKASSWQWRMTDSKMSKHQVIMLSQLPNKKRHRPVFLRNYHQALTKNI